MVKRIYIEMTGVDELTFKLRQAVDPERIKKGLFESAKFVAETVKETRFMPIRDKKSPALPGILTNRSHRLRNSIMASQTTKEGNAYIAKVGTNVEYAKVHEYGFTGAVRVSPHIRTPRVTVSLFGKRKKLRTGPIFVNTFTRFMNIPPRPVFQPVIESPYVQRTILDMMVEKVNEGLESK